MKNRPIVFKRLLLGIFLFTFGFLIMFVGILHSLAYLKLPVYDFESLVIKGFLHLIVQLIGFVFALLGIAVVEQ